MAMRLWTYKRPFQYKGLDYEVKFSFTLRSYTSKLYCNGSLIDEYISHPNSGYKVIQHKFQTSDQSSELSVFVGYFSHSNVGIEVHESNDLIYASHPNEDIYFAENKMKIIGPKREADKREREQRWQKNKYSLLADIGLGATFFIVAKVTDDLSIAALTGATLGLALVIAQRFVKVDLLGGFAVFGTVMLLISAVFSLAFQSEYLVQIKDTVMGLLGASAFLVDGVFRRGRYFGCRFERYLSSPIKHQHFVIGLGLIGACMASLNYGIATFLSKDVWLIYSTFIDIPIYIALIFLLSVMTLKKDPILN